MQEPYQQITAGFKQLLGSRGEQQDTCVLSPSEEYAARGCLALVADGMGGMENGAAFSRLTAQTMLDCFMSLPPQEDITQTLLQCYLAAREKALNLRTRDGGDGGSTLVAVLVRAGRCAFLSVGDSRIYLWRGHKLLPLTREQRLGPLLDERAALGQIAWEEALNNTKREALFNNITQQPPRPVDRNLTPITLMAGDRLLLMSDGVWGSISGEALRVLTSGPVDTALAQIMQAVTAQNDPKQDNASLAIVSYDGSIRMGA